MSVADALAFVRAVRADPALRAQVAALGDAAPAEALAGCVAGLRFDEQQLFEAFRIDWNARWLRATAPQRDADAGRAVEQPAGADRGRG